MASFGQMLKQEREIRKISLREIADSTKISVRHLSALESDDFRYLPGGVFNRGFIRAYAEYVGVDPEPMVRAYLAEKKTQDRNGASQAAARFAAIVPPAARRRSTVTRTVLPPLLLASAALLSLGLWAYLAFARAPAEEAARATLVAAPQTPARSSGQAGPETRAAEVAANASATRTVAGQPTVAPASVVVAQVRVVRPTSGWLNCDNRKVEVLDGLAAGTRLDFRCSRFLLLDAADGSALHVGLGGSEPAPLVREGEPLRQRRFEPTATPTSD